MSGADDIACRPDQGRFGRTMQIDHLDDWDRRLARQDAFWERAIIDRPVVVMQWPRTQPHCPRPAPKRYSSQRERWLDTERVVEEAVASARNTEFWGDALPLAWPNLGPEVFSAFFGQDMEYTADTSWAIPIIEDWSHIDHVHFAEDNVYWRKLIEMTDALLDAGKGLFYTGISDFHPGGDAIAAFRDPMDLNTDLLLTPTPIQALLEYVNETYFQVYDFYYGKLRAAGQPVASWPGIVSTRKWYVPSNDFSCMISAEMFEEFFLPGIVEECRHMEASLYHLDGPAALRYLDCLLEIPALNAIQWVYGAGNGRATDWLDVYRRCQAAGKGIQLHIELDELETVIEHLAPEGAWMSVGARNPDEAAHVLSRVGKWV